MPCDIKLYPIGQCVKFQYGILTMGKLEHWPWDRCWKVDSLPNLSLRMETKISETERSSSSSDNNIIDASGNCGH